ncbi:uracil phosphoribosyltransferase [Persephonella sp.]
MENIHVVKNPILINIVTKLRDINTKSYLFRKYLSEAGKILLLESLRSEENILKKTKIETWIGSFEFPVLNEDDFVFIPVLRAGLPMLDGVLELIENGKSGFLGIKRDERTLESKVYYSRLPDLNGKTVYILDPMLATGGSLINAVTKVKEKNPKRIISLNIIGSPEGLKSVTSRFKDLEIYIGSVDKGLNNKGFIIPGIGDAGDRAFNT